MISLFSISTQQARPPGVEKDQTRRDWTRMVIIPRISLLPKMLPRLLTLLFLKHRSSDAIKRRSEAFLSPMDFSGETQIFLHIKYQFDQRRACRVGREKSFWRAPELHVQNSSYNFSFGEKLDVEKLNLFMDADGEWTRRGWAAWRCVSMREGCRTGQFLCNLETPAAKYINNYAEFCIFWCPVLEKSHRAITHRRLNYWQLLYGARLPSTPTTPFFHISKFKTASCYRTKAWIKEPREEEKKEGIVWILLQSTSGLLK